MKTVKIILDIYTALYMSRCRFLLRTKPIGFYSGGLRNSNVIRGFCTSIASKLPPETLCTPKPQNIEMLELKGRQSGRCKHILRYTKGIPETNHICSVKNRLKKTAYQSQFLTHNSAIKSELPVMKPKKSNNLDFWSYSACLPILRCEGIENCFQRKCNFAKSSWEGWALMVTVLKHGIIYQSPRLRHFDRPSSNVGVSHSGDWDWV